MFEVLKNQYVESDYEVQLICDEFACVCPLSQAVDVAKISITYIPQEHLIESKSLKQYLSNFRTMSILQEFAINKICFDLAHMLKPKYLEVKGEFSPRNGIKSVLSVKWGR